ncbi:2-polyprenyl-3-methyl-5-hydroxy-6-metoxy-1,4-benzoquinol methylase [Pedobacter sp. CG_S7]|uniref:methyltransferase domain-containing protein n=1 Tax=Pedobacter sp. CG_S7 TaxID=3143930 RepID=UPI00339AFD6C
MDTTYRSDAPELMDNFDMEGEVLRDALDKIAHINQLLGGNKVTVEGINTLIKNSAKKSFKILDVGCGNGDMLRELAKYAQKVGLSFDLYGIDANKFTINHAQNLSVNYPNISFICEDIFEEIEKENTYDIILCTLTLHHFKNEEIIRLLSDFAKHSYLGFVINDLHRSAIAYYLFNALCFVFRLNNMSKQDGLISILRGFKREDFLLFSKQLHFHNYLLNWRWAFRYQWIVTTYG